MRIINENTIGQRKLLLRWLHDLPALISLVEPRAAPILNVALEIVVLQLTLFLGKFLIMLMMTRLPLGDGVHLVLILFRAFVRHAHPIVVLPSLCALRELQVLLPGWAELVAVQVLLLSCQSSLPRNIF